MTSLRAGLSGCGAAGRAAIASVRTHAHCDIVAVHDDDPAAVLALQTERGIGIGTTRFDELLATGVDFVVLNGPLAARPAQVEAACEQAVPVLLHAPMAANCADAERMAAAAAAAGLPLGVLVPEMADPLWEQVRGLYADGWFGGLVAVQAFRADAGLLRLPPAADDPRLAAGPLPLLVADLHLLTWLTGRSCVAVAAQATRSLLPTGSDSVVASAGVRGGALATFAASFVTAGRGFMLHGTEGRVHWHDDHLVVCGARPIDGAVLRYDAPGRERCLPLAELEQRANPLRPALELHGRFARWLDDTDGFPCPAEQALADLRTVAAIERALRSGAVERVGD